MSMRVSFTGAALSLVGLIALGQSTPDPGRTRRTVDEYVLPPSIEVVKTDLPSTPLSNGHYLVQTKDIDFSESFDIQTERYHLTKNEDWLPNRLIGHGLSVIGKTVLLSTEVGAGPDEELTKRTLAMLEQRKDIYNLTLRLGHNEAFKDFGRLFADEKVAERNPFLARLLMGVPTTLFHELWAEFFRGDYYNPLTQTAVIYSNIDGIVNHEIGHHQDFNRFSSDWRYSLSGVFPTMIVAHEYRASENAKDLLSKSKEKDFSGILVPAFGTYALLLAGALVKRTKRNRAGDEEEDNKLGCIATVVLTTASIQTGAAAYHGLTALGMDQAPAFLASALVPIGAYVLAQKVKEEMENS